MKGHIMTELEEYRTHLNNITGYDAGGCNRVARELNTDDLNCLYITTLHFSERRQARQMRAYQLLKIASWFQCEALNEALSALDADEVAEVYTMLDMKLSSVSV